MRSRQRDHHLKNTYHVITEVQFVRKCETHFILGEKCTPFNELCSVNALYIIHCQFYLTIPFR